MSICFAILLFVLSPALTLANGRVVRVETPAGASEFDDWIICTRHLPIPTGRTAVCCKMRYWRRTADTWTLSSAEEFHATLEPQTTVCVFVDGNRIEAEEADYRGKIVRRKLDCCVTPVRFVNWSWPSEQIRGPVRDARTKIARANGNAYYLASWISELPARQSTSLIGYSLGSRVVSGAIHILEGGTFASNSLGGVVSSVNPRVLFIAATIPHRWLQRGGENELFLMGVARVLSIYNSNDKVLRLFKYDRSSDGGIVLGHRPIPRGTLGPIAPLIRQVDVASRIRKNHGLQHYMNAIGQKTICKFVAGDAR
ncbi:hypothetical protein ACFL2H_02810 [Planctomycetota bacterium]